MKFRFCGMEALSGYEFFHSPYELPSAVAVVHQKEED